MILSRRKQLIYVTKCSQSALLKNASEGALSYARELFTTQQLLVIVILNLLWSEFVKMMSDVSIRFYRS